MIERARVDFPDPDSPTTPSVWPAAIDTETSFTAAKRVLLRIKYLKRCSTRRSGSPGGTTGRVVLSLGFSIRHHLLRIVASGPVVWTADLTQRRANLDTLFCSEPAAWRKR